MKSETKRLLKEKGKIELFTDERYEKVKAVMEYGMTKDEWLNEYLNLDPQNKAQWIADHIVKFSESGHI